MKLQLISTASLFTLAFTLNPGAAIRATLDCVDYPMPYRRGDTAEAKSCAEALIRGFPFSTTTGTFHSYGGNDDFQLPRTSSHEDCFVTVDIAPSTTFETSWQAVWTLAGTMNTACSKAMTSAGLPYTGGTITAGVSVTMGRLRQRVLGNGNGTADVGADRRDEATAVE